MKKTKTKIEKKQKKIPQKWYKIQCRNDAVYIRKNSHKN